MTVLALSGAFWRFLTLSGAFWRFLVISRAGWAGAFSKGLPEGPPQNPLRHSHIRTWTVESDRAGLGWIGAGRARAHASNHISRICLRDTQATAFRESVCADS